MEPIRPLGTVAQVTATLRAWLAADDEQRLIVETSGSSGAPKQVVLSRAALVASAASTTRRLGGEGQWVLKLPPTYIAGVQVLSRSLIAGADPVEDWPDGDGWFTSLVPTQLHRALDDPAELAALQRAHTILLGGGPIDPALRVRAREEGLKVVATYGSAETAGGCVYDGMPLDGVAVALAPDGRIRIAGPTLFDEYAGDPELTRETLRDGWFHTSDAGRFDEDGRLQVLGRVDDLVISGGVNVPTVAVAARLREHPDVRDAAVVGVQDPEWGQRVIALVVGPLDTDAARDWVAERHPRSWAPREVIHLDEIPQLPNGKPDRQALQRLAAGAAR